MVRGVINKFQPCLPEAAEDRLLAEKLLDLPGTLRFLAQTRAAVAATAGVGARLPDAAVDDIPDLQPELVILTDVETYQPRNPVVWVDDVAGLTDACAAMAQETVLGLDVETLLDLASCCLIQIAAPTRTWIIDPLALTSLDPLAPVFASAAITKVIHHAQFERRVLAKLGLALDGVFDTLDASRARHGRDAAGGHSLAAVVRRELGQHVDKTQQTSNWARRPLTDAQLRYAAADAEVLLGLREALASETSPVDETHDTASLE